MFDNKSLDAPLHDGYEIRAAKDLDLNHLFDSTNEPEYDADALPDRSKLARKRIKRKPRRVVEKGAPRAPAKFKAEADPESSNRINLSWDDPVTDDGSFLTYTIEQRQSNLVRNKWITIKTYLAGNTFVDKNALNDFAYEYRIFATDASGLDGQYSKSAKARARVAISPIQLLWNTVNDQITAHGLTLDRLCLLMALRVSRKYDKGRPFIDREHSANGVYVLTKLATEERIIRDAGESFSILADVKMYLRQRELPLTDHDSALVAYLRPAALIQALGAYANAGIDLLSKLGGYVYETAKNKLVDEIARDININNECEHNSKADRQARANDPSKVQRFTRRMNPDKVFNEAELEDNAGSDVKIRNEAIQPDFVSAIVEPTIIRSKEELNTATQEDLDVTVDALHTMTPADERLFLHESFVLDRTQAELAMKYEGTVDPAAIKRIARRQNKAAGSAKDRLIRHAHAPRPQSAFKTTLAEWMGMADKRV